MKPIKGWEGLYSVDKHGNIYSHRSKKYLKPFKDKKGYLMVDLRINNTKNTKKVHRLVGKAFMPNTNNKPQINHINGIKADNRVENLEWVTNSENAFHAHNVLNRYTVRGENHGKSKITNKEAKLIKQKLNNGQKVINISRELNIHYHTVYNIKRGATWTQI